MEVLIANRVDDDLLDFHWQTASWAGFTRRRRLNGRLPLAIQLPSVWPMETMNETGHTGRATERVIVALDFSTLEEAWALVENLGPVAPWYKVGLQLLTSAGATIVSRLGLAQKSVFLDLKLFEIPSSVAAAVAVAGDLGAKLVSVHAFAGEAVLSAAARAAAPFPGLQVVALTVITSMNDKALRQVGIHARVEDQVRLLGQLAMASGCAGVIASAREASLLRPLLGSDALILTPGIQLEGGLPTDQVRTATPAAAFAAGASHIIVGRAIASARSPTSAFLEAAAQAPGSSHRG